MIKKAPGMSEKSRKCEILWITQETEQFVIRDRSGRSTSPLRPSVRLWTKIGPDGRVTSWIQAL
jgi:hypothetical protein